MTEYSGEGDTLVFESGISLTIGAWHVAAESGPPESWSGDLVLHDFVDWPPDHAYTATVMLREHDGKPIRLSGDVRITRTIAETGTSTRCRFQGVGELILR